MSAHRAICYLRVSTARQGASGLGLEAQRTAVMTFAAGAGMAVMAEFLEVESGKKDDRPKLAAALAACRLHGAKLVIAKLDRLARNVAFIANLMDGGVDFVACDMPQANRLTLHIMAAMAEYERELISQRTKTALEAARARGVRLGNPNGAAHLHEGCTIAAAVSARERRELALTRSLAVYPILADLKREGIVGPSACAAALNERGIPSAKGGRWHATQLRRVLARYDSVKIAALSPHH